MQSITFVSPSLSSPFFKNTRLSHGHNRVSCTRIFASRRDEDPYNYNGRMVDEGMIVLRKRIHEMMMFERNYEPPEDWMEWEKNWYTSYDVFICNLMGVLQTQLMHMRPSLALGMVALVALSVPTSIALVLLHLNEMIKGIVDGVHLK